jgi:uncharacterized repeat protein (TIGR03803 family)
MSGRKALERVSLLVSAAGLWITILHTPNLRAQGGAVVTTLHSFGVGADGRNPEGAGLVQGSDGYFYGTTGNGGANGAGIIYRVGADRAYTNLHSFISTLDGAGPFTGLTELPDGYFYGTAMGGGTNGHGTVFKISPAGAFAVLYSFSGGADGGNPVGKLADGADGYLYGTTGGTVFKTDTNGNLVTLCSLTNASGSPEAGLIRGSGGDFYDTTVYGTVFKVSTNGFFEIVANIPDFGGGPSGVWIAAGSDGYLYGTTSQAIKYGTVFRMNTAGPVTNLYTFTNATYGISPFAPLVQGSDGYLYGTTSEGGAYQSGTIFRITTNGVLTSLHNFNFTNEGSYNLAPMIQAKDGRFYGATQAGGLTDYGTVFRMTVLPELQSLSLINGTRNLTWSVEAGSTYQAQYSSDLNSHSWVNLGGPLLATGATLAVTDTNVTGGQRFYRVLVLP